jgi:hypothetical protein
MISSDLIALLNEWAKEFDSTLDRSDPVNSGFKTEEDERKFYAKGKCIYGKLVKELGNAYEVHYLTWLD